MFPLADVVLLPVPNTTTEELAGYLLDAVLFRLAGAGPREAGGSRSVELELAEAPDVRATVHTEISPALGPETNSATPDATRGGVGRLGSAHPRTSGEEQKQGQPNPDCWISRPWTSKQLTSDFLPGPTHSPCREKWSPVLDLQFAIRRCWPDPNVQMLYA